MARLGSLTLASVWLLSQVAAQQYPRNTANGTITKASPTPTSSKSGSITSFYSEINGPYLFASSSTWTQVIIPTTVGTVMVIVNEATNETTSTTVYHTDYEKNGSSTLLTRTDTNAAGTVTQIVTDMGREPMTIAYPTNYFEVAESLTWTAVLPTYHINSTCCFPTPTLSATPTHTPFVQVGPLDGEDSRGWLYSLVGVNYGEAYTVLDSTEVSSLWSGQTLGIEYDGCPYEFCQYTVTSASPASAVQAQPGAILATSTTTISIAPAGGSSSKGSTSSSFTALPDQDSETSKSKSPETMKDTPSPGPSPEPTRPDSTQVSGAPAQTSAGSPQQTSKQPENTGSTSPPAPGSTATPPVPTSSVEPVTSTAAAGMVITIGSSVVSANSASQFIIEDQTLALGSSITIGSGSSTTVVALQTSGLNTVLVVGDSSSTLNAAAAITIGGSVVTADSASNYVIGGQTLVPGSEIVVGGTTISLAPGGTQLIEGTKTMVQSTGIGGIIWSVFGGGTTTSETGTATATYVQASGGGRVSSSLVMLPCSLVLLFLMIG